jgi:rhamnose transport system permease protein
VTSTVASQPGSHRDAALSPARRRRLTLLLKGRSFAVLGVLAILIVVFSLTTQNFATADSFRSITVNAALFAIVACGQGVVILTRNYDLSVGSVMGLAAYVAYDWGHQVGDLAPVVIPGIAIAIGLGAGLINGILVGYFRIPSIAATLGTLSIFRGILFVYGDGRIVTRDLLPDWAIALVSTQVFGIVASLVIIASIVVVIAALALRYLPLGRQVYAVGSNPAAVDAYGLDAARTVLVAYLACGLMAGLAGFLFGPQVGYIIQYAGQNYELTAIAACVIGGISVLGGSGNILGAADVFVNVAGGVRVDEPAVDLSVALAVASSLRDRPVPADIVAFGEIGLAGEVRGVNRAQHRMVEAAAMGFRRAIVPVNVEGEGIEAVQVRTLVQALDVALP